LGSSCLVAGIFGAAGGGDEGAPGWGRRGRRGGAKRAWVTWLGCGLSKQRGRHGCTKLILASPTTLEGAVGA
jgi:hypothetical protein